MCLQYFADLLLLACEWPILVLKLEFRIAEGDVSQKLASVSVEQRLFFSLRAVKLGNLVQGDQRFGEACVLHVCCRGSLKCSCNGNRPGA